MPNKTLAGLSAALCLCSTMLASSGDIEMKRVEFPVVLSDQVTYTMVGYLYSQKTGPYPDCDKKHDTVQVLLHGGTYNHRYWDAGQINGVDYSYARYMAAQCYSVLALDRLGSGESSRPSGDFLNKDQNAAGIAQVLIALRTAGNPTQRKFKKIALVGHSLGTFSALYTLGTYGNLADVLVATGWLNAPAIVPLDPYLLQSALQQPDIVFPPEVRAALFYYAPSADPAVIAFDNSSLADSFPRAFFLDALQVLAARAQGDIAAIKALTRVDQVHVPTFIQLGDFDILAPALHGAAEAAFYSGAPSVTVNTLSGMGHDYNLHLNRLAGWQSIATWLAQTITN